MLLTYWNVSKRVENIAGKRENEGLDYYFLHFLQNSIGNLSLGRFVPNNKILTLTKLKTYADDKIIVTEKLKFVLGKVENIVEKEKMLATSIFSFFHNVFKRILVKGR